MSVLIKRMSKPTECNNCEFVQHGATSDWCYITEKQLHCDCPLIEIHSHGKLIDADAFIAEQQHLYCKNCAKRKGMKNGRMKFVYNIGDAPCRACEIMDVLDSLKDAPTIISAEESET